MTACKRNATEGLSHESIPEFSRISSRTRIFCIFGMWTERFFSEVFSQSTCIWPAGSCSWAAVDPHATPGVAAASKLWRSRIVQAKLRRQMFTNLIEGLGKYQAFLWKQLSKWSALSFWRSMEWKWSMHLSMQMHRNKKHSKDRSGRLLALSAAWEHGKRGKCRWLALAALANATVYRHQALCIVWFPCAPHQTLTRPLQVTLSATAFGSSVQPAFSAQVQNQPFDGVSSGATV